MRIRNKPGGGLGNPMKIFRNGKFSFNTCMFSSLLDRSRSFGSQTDLERDSKFFFWTRFAALAVWVFFVCALLSLFSFSQCSMCLLWNETSSTRLRWRYNFNHVNDNNNNNTKQTSIVSAKETICNERMATKAARLCFTFRGSGV